MPNHHLDSAKVNSHLAHMTQLFSLQDPPSGIIPLLSTFTDEPYKFAATIIWAINRGITVDELIESSLLHQFVAYHCPDISAEDNNPFTQVFQYLSQQNNQQLNELIAKAQTTACGHRGLEAFSLTGEKNNEENLQHVKQSPQQLALTLKAGNILNLHSHFGFAILEQAVNLLLAQPPQQSRATLAKILPAYIEGLSEEARENITKNGASLAEFLNKYPVDVWHNILNSLNRAPIEAITKNRDQLALLFQSLPKENWPNFLSIAENIGIKVVKNIWILGTSLNDSPVDKWPHFVKQLTHDHINNLTQASPNPNLMQVIASNNTAEAMRECCKLTPARLLVDFGTRDVRELIKTRHRKNPMEYTLSPEEFDCLMLEQLYFSRILNYLSKKQTDLDNKKTTALNLEVRINDFCETIGFLMALFKKEDMSEDKAKKNINNYITSSQREKAAIFNNTGRKTFFNIISLSNERYNSYRDSLVNIDIKTLRIRLEEFIVSINKLSRDKNAPHSMKSVATKIQDMLMEINPQEEQDQQAINSYNLRKFNYL